MRIEMTERARIGGGKYWNARLLDENGSELSRRLFLRDAKTKRSNARRIADVQKDVDSGYRFPLLRQRSKPGATLFATSQPF